MAHIRELAYFQGAWHNRDVTADSEAPAAVVGSVLAGFPVGASSDPRVYFADPAGHVQELAYFHGAWHNRDVTADSGAPARMASSMLAGFPAVAPSDPRVYYVGPGGHVQELAYFQGGWHSRDVTADSGAPAAVARSALAGFPVGDSRVYYLSPGGRVQELGYVPPTQPGGQGAWRSRDVTGDAGAPAAATSLALAGFPVGVDADPRVYYVGPGGHVQELAYFQGGWHSRDVTAAAGAPAAATGSALAGFQVGFRDPRVYYLGPGSHVQELAYFQGGWHSRDVTAAAGAPAAATSSVLAGFRVGADRDPRVYYLGPGRHVRELAYFQGGWHNRDVTADAGAPDPAVLSSALVGFPVAGRDPRVYYLD